jgi:hypothetical protein
MFVIFDHFDSSVVSDHFVSFYPHKMQVLATDVQKLLYEKVPPLVGLLSGFRYFEYFEASGYLDRAIRIQFLDLESAVY